MYNTHLALYRVYSHSKPLTLTKIGHYHPVANSAMVDRLIDRAIATINEPFELICIYAYSPVSTQATQDSHYQTVTKNTLISLKCQQ